MTNPTPADRAKALVASIEDLAAVDRAWLEQRITQELQAESNAQLMRNRAHDRQADVAAFVCKFGQHQEPRPGFPPQDVLDMRVRLIAEEFCEFLRDAGYEGSVHIDRWDDSAANYGASREIFHWFYEPDTQDTIADRNLAKAADALIDMEYVILGTHVILGINSNPLWAAVQAANMSKEGGATREDGKILKPKNWTAPDIEGELRKQGWSDDRGDKGFGSTGR